MIRLFPERVKRPAALWAAVVLLATSAGQVYAAPGGEAVIVFRSTPSLEDLAPLDGASLVYQRLTMLPMVLVRAAPSDLQALLDGHNVRSVYPNLLLEPYLDQGVAAVGAPRVWSELGLTGHGVTIAIVDSGINTQHPDLAFSTKVSENVLLQEPLPTEPSDQLVVVSPLVVDSDRVGHGTLVASVAAGSGAASGGQYAGVARDARLVGLGSDELTTFGVLRAFDWILEHHTQLGIRVVNNSWGLSGPFDPDEPINVATRALYEAGITVVFAAGNSGPFPDTLNRYSVAPWVIGVAAASRDRTLASFSARGIRGDPLYHPTITAPGVGIVAARDASSFMGAVAAGPDGAPYMAISGTSLAAPHVAGVVALLLEANDALTPDAVKSILVWTADPMPGYGEHEVGAGFVDAFEAARLARG